jgi:hypothetical protein
MGRRGLPTTWPRTLLFLIKMFCVQEEYRYVIVAFLGYAWRFLKDVWCTNIMFLDIIHRPVYISKHNISETGFCLRLEIGTNSIDRAQLSRFYLKTETESSLRNVVFWNINRTMDNVQEHNICTDVPSSQTFRSCIWCNLSLRKLCKAYRKASNDISFVSGECLMNIHHMQYVKWRKVSCNLEGDSTQSMQYQWSVHLKCTFQDREVEKVNIRALQSRYPPFLSTWRRRQTKPPKLRLSFLSGTTFDIVQRNWFHRDTDIFLTELKKINKQIWISKCHALSAPLCLRRPR